MPPQNQTNHCHKYNTGCPHAPWENSIVSEWRRLARQNGLDGSDQAVAEALVNEVFSLSEVCEQFTTEHERSKVRAHLLCAVTHLSRVEELIRERPTE